MCVQKAMLGDDVWGQTRSLTSGPAPPQPHPYDNSTSDNAFENSSRVSNGTPVTVGLQAKAVRCHCAPRSLITPCLLENAIVARHAVGCNSSSDNA